MKKFLAIPLLVLVLLSGATVNIATHFCNGIVADRSINLSGRLASCGMTDNDSHQGGINFTSHHCQNIKSSYTLSNTYVPASTLTVDAAKHIIHLDLIPAGLTLPEPSVAVQNIVNRPPGEFNPDHVDLDVICIYRI